jgi:parallel beta-helix repeat protein
VATTGSDRNPGTQSAPFATAQHGVSAANPGDVVCLGDGTYNESITFNTSGTASAWITLRSLNPSSSGSGGGATIAPGSSDIGVNPNGQSYIAVDNLVISDGLWGIVVSGGHHVAINGNLVSGAGAACIGFSQGDYYTVMHNTVHDCAKTWSGNSSGITIYEPTASDSLPGFHNVISYNISYNNSNPAPDGTDGNGISMDDTNHTQSDNIPYTGQTLIEENITYNNGGSGIRIGYSSGVTVRNNTSYWNEALTTITGPWRGDLADEYSTGTIWVNNIAVANPATNSDNTAILEAAGSGSVWLNNLTYDGTAGSESLDGSGSFTGNLLGMNPMLMNPTTNFQLQSESPASAAGTSSYGVPATDFAGNAWLSSPSIGAYR